MCRDVWRGVSGGLEVCVLHISVLLCLDGFLVDYVDLYYLHRYVLEIHIV